MTTQTIDVHAHVLTEETIRLLQREAPKAAPKLSEIDEQFGTLDVAGSIYRHFPRGGWDLDRRLADMAASKVDVQVLSVCPQTFVYNQPPAVAAGFARIQNDEIANVVAKFHPDRFLGIATLPMQDPKRAADELGRAMRTLNLRGAQSAPISTSAISTIRRSSRCGRSPTSWGRSSWCIRHGGMPGSRLALITCAISSACRSRPRSPAPACCSAACWSGFPISSSACAMGAASCRTRPGASCTAGTCATSRRRSSRSRRPSRSTGSTSTPSPIRPTRWSSWSAAPARDRVLLGSDYPFDMGMPDGVLQVKNLSIPPAEQTAILGARARELLGAVDRPAARAVGATY